MMEDIAKSAQYIAENRRESIKILCNFLATDVLLFWSDKPELHALQEQQWQPLLDLMQKKYSLVLNVSQTLTVPENKTAVKQMDLLLSRLEDKELCACFLCALKLKSVILGFLFACRKISSDEAFQCAFTEEIYQNKYWGCDEQEQESHRNLKAELLELEEYLYGKML